ncbi:molybdenum cofactor sulfurase protein [Blumeria hordei DH14]|uniref:Molybdenum cofactor sulfurase n=1 Tax=Blumeria graminis f. sp. hordei (strain DH14) TaxID=546991 RepID=N1J891_BLUG1|nr:molybdenum cofactor sulfurase protein [Blumeria hordei DH14]
MESAYNYAVETFRTEEYPMLKESIYLDHAGTTLYSKSLMESFMREMVSNLHGNPHSVSPSSQLSSKRIDETRQQVLEFFNADPKEFDVVFVSNATAGIKLVMDSFRGQDASFNYAYHLESHTSIIGVRENSQRSYCWNDSEVELWLSGSKVHGTIPDLNLFSYPAQSNMSGRRLPLSWSHKVRLLSSTKEVPIYTLLDASSLVSTAPLDLSDTTTAPDFTVLSFYKIFGFPDLGALIVRKKSTDILRQRKYFGGGTVDAVISLEEPWHALKEGPIYHSLEDGTLPIHSILALEVAIQDYYRLYSSMARVSQHTNFLAQKLHHELSSLQHGNLRPLCKIHSQGFQADQTNLQGPIIAFNLLNNDSSWISNSGFETLAAVRGIHVRTGSICNPGGVAACLELEPWEIRRNYFDGFRCSTGPDIFAGKVTGVIRVSIGAMSTLGDIMKFISFLREFFVEPTINMASSSALHIPCTTNHVVESLTIYPIKSCGGFVIPPGVDWEVRPEGLAWDREWLLVHEGSGQALSQKRYPQMALIRPRIDFQSEELVIKYDGNHAHDIPEILTVSLTLDHTLNYPTEKMNRFSSRVCGDEILANVYQDTHINRFFTVILGVPCLLARFPAGGAGLSCRQSKAHVQKHQALYSNPNSNLSGENSVTTGSHLSATKSLPILLSNESPILMINRASLDHLNNKIIQNGGKPASASVFRGNIVIGPKKSQHQEPYSEDHWTSITIGLQRYKMLGSCRRCNMICIDQKTAEKNEEPLVTLAKTRTFNSKTFFGCHMCHMPHTITNDPNQTPIIRVGDPVQISTDPI